MISSLRSFLYPSICQSCRQKETRELLLCSTCLEEFSLLNKKFRCKRCFRQEEGLYCSYCEEHPTFFSKTAFCFDADSSALFLLRDLDRFSKTIASLLFIQYSQLEFPAPQTILGSPAFSEVAIEFRKLITIEKEEKVLQKVLYLSETASLPEVAPFIGKNAFHLALFESH
jgi:hypothetical protein